MVEPTEDTEGHLQEIKGFRDIGVALGELPRPYGRGFLVH